MTLTTGAVAATADNAVVMDLPTAAAYAGVPIAELARAIHRRELDCRSAPGGRLLLARTAIEEWVAKAERGRV